MKVAISTLNRQEKLDLMEELWADLTGDARKFDSPAWHAEELAETERRVASGDEQFMDWEAAKKKIISDHQ